MKFLILIWKMQDVHLWTKEAHDLLQHHELIRVATKYPHIAKTILQ